MTGAMYSSLGRSRTGQVVCVDRVRRRAFRHRMGPGWDILRGVSARIICRSRHFRRLPFGDTDATSKRVKLLLLPPLPCKSSQSPREVSTLHCASAVDSSNGPTTLSLCASPSKPLIGQQIMSQRGESDENRMNIDTVFFLL